MQWMVSPAVQAVWVHQTGTRMGPWHDKEPTLYRARTCIAKLMFYILMPDADVIDRDGVAFGCTGRLGAEPYEHSRLPDLHEHSAHLTVPQPANVKVS